MRRVYKYGTGQEIPEDAKYLNTVVQTRMPEIAGGITTGWQRCWLVWHYYEVRS